MTANLPGSLPANSTDQMPDSVLVVAGGAGYHPQLHNDVATALNNVKTVNVLDYGAIPVGGTGGTGGADSTTAIQNAITAAGTGGIVRFPNCGTDGSGNSLYYKVSSTLNWGQGQTWLGDGVDFANMVWFGAAGGTMIQRSGGNSQGTIRGMTIGGRGILSYDLQIGSWPGVILDFTSIHSSIDYGVRLSYLFTGYCSGDAWSIPGSWTNFWADHIRWGAVAGFWINAVGGAGFSLSSFVVDTFTCDMAPATPSKWGFNFDASAGSASGPIIIQNARIESTGGALASNQATVTLNSNTSAGPQWNLRLANLAIDKGGSTTGTYSLIRHIGNANGQQLSFDLEHIRFGFVPATNLVIGNVPAAFVQPPLLADINKYEFMGNPQIFGNGATVHGALTHDALGTTVATAGFMGAAPVTQQSVGGAAADAGTTQTLANNLRTALINLGLCKT